ncbi:MAG: ComEC/Rec2 family competence protein [Bacillota bacterium]
MKKSNPILHWDDYYIEGYALFLMLLGCFHPWIFVILASYLYWQRRNIKLSVILIGTTLLLVRFYSFALETVPTYIHGEAKIVEINVYEYSDMIILTYQNDKFQAFVSSGVYQVGDIILIEADVKSFRGQTIPYGFNQKTYYLSQNVKGYLDIYHINYVRDSFSIYTLREQMNQYLSGFQSQIYLKALILGEKSFTDEQSSLYKDLGILYLFTVSGLHIYGLMLLLKKVFFYFSLSEKTQFILTILIYIIILYFNQFSMSVLRIVLIFIMQNLFKKMKINLTPLDFIHLAFFILLIFRIEWIYHLGLLMLFIILNFIYLMSHTYQKLNGYLKRLLLSVIIIMSILPFQSSISPFLILLLPVIIFILTGPVYIFSILILFIPELDGFLSVLISHFETVMKSIESRNITIVLPALPDYGIILYYALLIIIFRSQTLISMLKRSLMIFLLFIYFVIDVHMVNDIRLYMIDVGQGDSILIVSSTCTILIDSYQHVLPLLNDLGIYHLDHLILTHSDNDHIQEAQSIIDNLDVHQVIINPYNTYPIIHGQIIEMQSNDFMRCGDLSIQFLGPIREYENLNNNSLVFHLFIENKIFLFTGDIEQEVELDLIQTYGRLLKSDVLKVAHHGSNSSSSVDFLRLVDPEIALISLDGKNRYGFPSQEVISRLKILQVDTYRTDTMGTIVYSNHQKKEKWYMYLPF